MKKLNLKVSELMNPTILTRQQLKNVMGGGGNFTTRTISCIFKNSDGTENVIPFTGCTLDVCQEMADDMCSSSDTCNDVDCQQF
jgi:hypothetical protein